MAERGTSHPQAGRDHLGERHAPRKIFSLGFALQTLGFKVINSVAWEKPDPPPNALHTAFTHEKVVAAGVRSGRLLSRTYASVLAVLFWCVTTASWAPLESRGRADPTYQRRSVGEWHGYSTS